MREALGKLYAADFEAEYAAFIGRACQLASDKTLIMAPPPFLGRIGASAWHDEDRAVIGRLEDLRGTIVSEKTELPVT